MPCINHKRKSSLSNNNKTSRKSKRSTKHKSRSFRNKKTRSNVRKMRGGAELNIKNIELDAEGLPQMNVWDTFLYKDVEYTINNIDKDNPNLLHCNNINVIKDFIFTYDKTPTYERRQKGIKAFGTIEEV